MTAAIVHSDLTLRSLVYGGIPARGAGTKQELAAAILLLTVGTSLLIEAF